MHRVTIRGLSGGFIRDSWELPERGKIPDDLALAFHQANPQDVVFVVPHEVSVPCVLCEELEILLYHDF